MNILDAFYATVHDYPGGAEALAARMGMSATILRNKANPNNTNNKPMLEDAEKAMTLTGDTRILDVLAAAQGGVFVKIDASAPASDLAVLELVTHVWRANGDVGAAVDDALADGKVERHEIVEVRTAIYRVQQAMTAMLMRLEGMAE